MTPSGSNLTSIVWDRADSEPDFAMLSRRSGEGWADVTAAAFRGEVVALAKGLIGSGLQAGERVALLSRTRYEWALLDFAVWAAGGVVVPIYETSSAEQVRRIVQDSGACVLVLETAEHSATWKGIAAALPGVRDVWRIEPGRAEGSLEDLAACGAGVSDEQVEERRTQAQRGDLATVIYTSGTTGRPKGCELTHGNFLAEIEGILTGVPEVFGHPDAAALLFLPLAHVLARVFQLAVLAGGVKLAHTGDVKNLLGDMGSFRPTFLLAVPRVFEKVYNAAEQRADAGRKGAVFRAAVDTAVAWSRANDGIHRPGLVLRGRHAVFDRLVYATMRDALGGRVRFAVCGGAPLAERLGHFFRGIGLVVLEGYGLTETTAAACVNNPTTVRMGTVGPPLPGVSVRIADGGEIQIRGGIVFREYAGDPEATRAAFTDDGWFRTGDLGELDAGFLRVTGRSKEILVTAGGKNVVPAVLEDAVRTHPLVSQCLVVGDGRPYVAALVTLDAEALPGWFEARRRPPLPLAQAVHDPQVHAGVQAAVDAANAQVSRAESIRRFRILDCDFTEVNGHLTPSMKLRRAEIMRDLAAEVDKLYG